MKTIFRFSILTAILTIALTSCEKNGGIDPNNPDNPAAVMQNVALSGTVRDTNGNPLSGVHVTTGSLDATTGSDGAFSFDKAGTVNDRVIMKYEKSGYFTLTRSCDMDSSLLYVEAMLYPQGNSDISLQTTFDASTAKTLQVGGMKIDFPASSIASADGKAYSGNVHVDMLYLEPDTTNENFSLMMPSSDFMCLTADNSKRILMNQGLVNVVLTDNNGNPLEIKNGASATVSFPASASVTNLPATVQLYTFDESKGLWAKDGTLTLQGNVYTGTVSHFSWKSIGMDYNTYPLPFSVDACGKPVDDAYISGFIYFWFQNGNIYKHYIYHHVSQGIAVIWMPVFIGINNNDIATLCAKATYNGESLYQVIDIHQALNYIVNFNFDKDCDNNPTTADITFDLLPFQAPDDGEWDIKFIIRCRPAMPMTISGDRIDPLTLLMRPASPAPILGYTLTKTGGDADYSDLFVGSLNWNADFTEMDYGCTSKGLGTWIGTIQLKPIDDALIQYIKTTSVATGIKSIAIGINNPVPITVHDGE